MNLTQLKSLFVEAGCTKLYAKPLAENDNSKNQVYFGGAIEALNILPSRQVYADNTDEGPSFKAVLNFSWLLDSGQLAQARHAKLILYSQYPEVRFSGFLLGCKAAPSDLMVGRVPGRPRTAAQNRRIIGRVLFLGVSPDKQVVGYVAAGNTPIAAEFNATARHTDLALLTEIALPHLPSAATERTLLLAELHRINELGWINSKQLSADGRLMPCNASQCGGFTLEAELQIPKNSNSIPDFHGWEVKQYDVKNFERIETSKAITLMTPQPDGGFYTKNGVEDFVRKFGYPDQEGRADRINFGGRHYSARCCKRTALTMHLLGYDLAENKITDADGSIALVSAEGEVAAQWSFNKLIEHWSRKHAKAVYVPSNRRLLPSRQYCYGHKVRLAQITDALRLLKAFASGAVYYDPGIKVEAASTETPSHKERSQFRVAAKNVGALYEKVETVEV